jgi:hypothetical protein
MNVTGEGGFSVGHITTDEKDGRDLYRVLVHVSGQVAVEISRVPEAHKLGGEFIGLHVHVIVLGQADGFLPVHAENSVFALDVDADRRAFGQNHCAFDGEMRCNRDDEDVSQFRRQDRPPGRQRVRGGPGGRRGDESISHVGGQQATIHIHREMHGTDDLSTADNCLVKRVRNALALSGTDMFHAQHHAVLDPGLAFQQLVEAFAAFLVLDLNQKSQPSEVDSQNRQARGGAEMRGPQHRPVTAEGDEQVEVPVLDASSQTLVVERTGWRVQAFFF